MVIFRSEQIGGVKMGLIKWWKKMEATYGHMDSKDAFKQGVVDGKLLTMEVKARQMVEKMNKPSFFSRFKKRKKGGF